MDDLGVARPCQSSCFAYPLGNVVDRCRYARTVMIGKTVPIYASRAAALFDCIEFRSVCEGGRFLEGQQCDGMIMRQPQYVLKHLALAERIKQASVRDVENIGH